MKVLATLPDSTYYQPIPSKKDGWFYWQDKASELVIVRSENPEPWEKEQTIFLGVKKGTNRDKRTYTKSLEITCYPPSEGLVKAQIVRDRWAGKIFHSVEPTLAFYAIPCDSTYLNQLLISVITKSGN